MYVEEREVTMSRPLSPADPFLLFSVRFIGQDPSPHARAPLPSHGRRPVAGEYGGGGVSRMVRSAGELKILVDDGSTLYGVQITL